MASTVNEQITDSITQVNVEVVGMAPGVAMANLYQATSQALAFTAQNMSVAQQQGATLMINATAVGTAVLAKIAASVA